MTQKADWVETHKTAVVSTANMPYELAEKLESNAQWPECPFVWEKTNYGYRIWTGSDKKSLPKEIRPLIRAAKKEGFRWVEFDMDGTEQEEFKTWEW